MLVFLQVGSLKCDYWILGDAFSGLILAEFLWKATIAIYTPIPVQVGPSATSLLSFDHNNVGGFVTLMITLSLCFNFSDS